MPTALDRLLESLDPERVLDEVAARTDEALNSFPVQSVQITDWHQFKSRLIDFVGHVESKALRLRSDVRMDGGFAWGRCVKILMRRYGAEGEKAAFEMARTGNDGGWYAVLKAVARQIADQLAENETTARTLRYWGRLSVEQQLAATTEYLAKYGHLLPSELTEGSAARLRARFPKVLEQHPRLLQQLRKTGR